MASRIIARVSDRAEHYKAKAEACRKWCASALTQSEKDRWLKLAAEWDAMASEANPSGSLPWKVSSG
jgi:hypothetical protein